ncbi:Neural-cadherin [Portunus trituberculatus]|uniref:Neural-cadherin n=1 Tax=Portunus trituberculatus TaxID=210409 RepID=A0A5B7KFA4_PORTR|nr:Neural-cadherin [Portunus trituberculatus]
MLIKIPCITYGTFILTLTDSYRSETVNEFIGSVCSQGEEGWGRKEHVAETKVRLSLVDENDNDPVFSEDAIHLTLPEDTPRGSLLASFIALDPDNPLSLLPQGGESRVRYQVAPDSDPGHQFAVDETGTVRLVGNLDRETADTHNALVWAVDDGSPPRTATATLAVSVHVDK